MKSKRTEFKEFKKVLTPTKKEIEKHLKAAIKSLKAAVKLSNKTGIPFNSDVSFVNQIYQPVLFEKWKKILEPEEYGDLVPCGNNDGWNIS